MRAYNMYVNLSHAWHFKINDDMYTGGGQGYMKLAWEPGHSLPVNTSLHFLQYLRAATAATTAYDATRASQKKYPYGKHSGAWVRTNIDEQHLY